MAIKGLLTFLFVILVISSMGIYYLSPFTQLEFGVSGNYNFSTNTNDSTGAQFYQNMRFPSNNISYFIDEGCTIQKSQDMRDAFKIVSDLTDLKFYSDKANGEIIVTCNETNRYEKGMFIAGEGGPTRIIQAGEYNVILGGTILLIRSSKCERPNVAIHELFHVLGFVHSSNSNNIMYNFTKCSQIIGEDSINLINELYLKPNLPDLAFETVSASMHGRYLDIDMSIKNIGFDDADSAIIKVSANGEELKEISLSELDIGNGLSIAVTNIFVKSLSVKEVNLFIDLDSDELDKSNNNLTLEIKK